ncbi:MAG: hypothetical protein ACLTIG_07050 [Roseburia hominis]
MWRCDLPEAAEHEKEKYHAGRGQGVKRKYHAGRGQGVRRKAMPEEGRE